jgi:hypothetical protein
VARGRWGESVEVRVDDALIGRLPPVCVMTGARADGYVPLVVPKRLGVAWLLLLAGPVGLVVLAALYPRLRTRYVVRVPMSAGAFARLHLLWRRRLWCTALGVVGVVVALGTRWIGALSALIALGAVASLAVAIGAHVRVPWAQPSMTADARGRTITMTGVATGFKAAVASDVRR